VAYTCVALRAVWRCTGARCTTRRPTVELDALPSAAAALPRPALLGAARAVRHDAAAGDGGAEAHGRAEVRMVDTRCREVAALVAD
jgi:hypothetical protein